MSLPIALSLGEEELLLRIAARAAEIAAYLAPDDARERSRIEGLLDELADAVRAQQTT